MKIISKFPQHNTESFVILIPENDEDIWSIYNLLCVGDHITAVTSRKVIVGSSNSVKSNQTRVTFNCTLQVETFDCDMKAGEIRVKGKNLVESDYIKMGQYHTLDVFANTKIKIKKENWSKLYISKLYDAVNIDKKAETMVILMHEGLAHLFLLYNTLTKVINKIEVHIAKKRANFPEKYTKSVQKFFEIIYDSMMKSMDINKIGCIVVGSPGCLKDQYMDFIIGKNDKSVISQKSKFVCVSSSSGFKHSLNEIIQNEQVLSKINNTQLKNDIDIMNKFMETLHTKSGQAFYGLNFIKKAISQGAVSKLLISDALLRSTNVEQRLEYSKLVDSATLAGAQVRLISTIQHKRLDELGGVAAILYYPMPELETECVDENILNFSMFD